MASAAARTRDRGTVVQEGTQTQSRRRYEEPQPSVTRFFSDRFQAQLDEGLRWTLRARLETRSSQGFPGANRSLACFCSAAPAKFPTAVDDQQSTAARLAGGLDAGLGGGRHAERSGPRSAHGSALYSRPTAASRLDHGIVEGPTADRARSSPAKTAAKLPSDETSRSASNSWPNPLKPSLHFA